MPRLRRAQVGQQHRQAEARHRQVPRLRQEVEGGDVEEEMHAQQRHGKAEKAAGLSNVVAGSTPADRCYLLRVTREEIQIEHGARREENR